MSPWRAVAVAGEAVVEEGPWHKPRRSVGVGVDVCARVGECGNGVDGSAGVGVGARNPLPLFSSGSQQRAMGAR